MAAFVLQKISDRGSSDPIVARTALQTFELAQPFVAEAVRQELGTIAMDVQRRLSECATIRDELQREIDEALDAARKSGLNVQASGRTVEIPSIIRLEERAERFLYSAKLCLRETARLFKPLFGQHFDENYKSFTEWAIEEFGAADPLSALLLGDRPWIAHVIEMRNGIEHPTHRAGPLHIRNFHLDQEAVPPQLRPPEWWQGTSPPSSIYADMGTVTDNLLTFYEELLVVSLLKVNRSPIITIAEIPESSRREEAPLRFKVTLTHLPP